MSVPDSSPGRDPNPDRFPALLDGLDELDDAQLQALIARAQALLLDRPAPVANASPLVVEIVGREERRLLAFYRALAPRARGRALTFVRLLYGRARRTLHGPTCAVPR